MMLLFLLAACLTGCTLAAKPNIVFIFTDDQDARMNSVQYMGGVQAHMVSQGVSYMHHYCTVALCCPSRVNLWTGRAAHNTNVTGLSPPYGGYDKFVQQGLNDDWLFPWMQAAGYQTYYVGKLMNSFTEKNYNKPFPKGFNGTDFLCGPATYNYYKPVYQRNQAPPATINEYTVTALWNKSLGYLQEAQKSTDPFFMVMAPVAPHAGDGPKPKGYVGGGPIPAQKYVDAFPDIEVPRTLNFNPDVPSGTDWVYDIAQLNSSTVTAGDEYYRNRIRTLQSVDEVVNNTIAYLEQNGLLNNTYVIYSTDNGFHISQHRLLPGKNCPYEEDINIPMVIRGPGITPNTQVNVATSHTDVAATILTMAGADLPNYLDGSPMPAVEPNPINENFEHAAIEHWGDASADEVAEIPASANTTYKALRILGNGYDWYYSVWCNNQHELYNMTADPDQMHNLFVNYTYQPNETCNDGFSINRLESRLDAMIMVLKSCKASTCIKPWLALHPDGSVSNLPEAMNPTYDQFYEQEQNRVKFEWCDPGYIIAAEEPLMYYTYKAGFNASTNTSTTDPKVANVASLQDKPAWLAIQLCLLCLVNAFLNS